MDSKGISTVIGTVLLVLALFVVSSNVFLFTISENMRYSESVRESHQTDMNRFDEKITASDGNYSVWGDKVKVEVTLTNVGAVAAQIINLWVFDTTIQKCGFNDTIVSLNLNLNPGQTLDLRGSEVIEVSILGAGSADNFNSWFVTARGNTVAIEKTEEVIVAQVAQGIGSMAMDFYTFRYYKYSGTKLASYPAGISSFTIPYGQDIAFGVVLTNLDPNRETITLDLHSHLWLYFPSVPGQAVGPVWFIVNVTPNGTITTPYSPITMAYRETRLLVFATGTEGGFSKVSINQPQQDDKLCAVNLLLHGKTGSRDYGQNIPFVSLYVT